MFHFCSGVFGKRSNTQISFREPSLNAADIFSQSALRSAEERMGERNLISASTAREILQSLKRRSAMAKIERALSTESGLYVNSFPRQRFTRSAQLYNNGLY